MIDTEFIPLMILIVGVVLLAVMNIASITKSEGESSSTDSKR
jgi:hypothetical protein